MLTRFTLALSILLLASCATTSTTTVQPPAAEPAAADDFVTQSSSVETVDEHLFVPGPAEPQLSEAPVWVQDNVWAGLIDRFELEGCADHNVNLSWAKWYASKHEYMERIYNRARPWIYFIAAELEKRGLPGEIALLPIVESAFDPFAYSRGQALGTWQFIAETGQRYGLAQNWWYDGRRDVWASTHAALDYLTYMNIMFDSDWLLALAGYNSGEGRVRREIKRNRAKGQETNFWNLRLPRETRDYVPKLLGLSCLFRYPEQFDFEIPQTPNRPVIAALDIGYQSDLVLISQLSEVPIDQLYTLNPGFNRWATAPNGPHWVVLPLDGARRLEARLKNLNPETLMKWDQVLVEPGDSLSKLAARHHVPIDVIMTTNNLDGDMIRAGQKLRLPRDNQLMIDPYYAAAATELARLQSGLIAADRLTHRVRAGESLSVIAKRYRVSVNDLQRWNDISDPRTLQMGANIVVFHSPAAPKSSIPTSGTVRHTVQSGDSLWSIARKYKVRVNDLMIWNRLGNSAIIQPGQSIKIIL